jgi:hypothetical protein
LNDSATARPCASAAFSSALRPAAGDHQWPFGVDQQLQHRLEVFVPGLGHGDRETRHHLGRGHVRQHVLRQRQHHRPRGVADRGVEGAGHDLGQLAGVAHLPDPLGHIRKDSAVIDLLKGAPPPVAPRNLPDQDDQGHGVLLGGMDRDRGVAPTRPAADRAEAGSAGDLGVGDGHEPRAAFVPAGHDLDVRRVVQGIEQGQVALAGHAEDPVGALPAQAVNQQLGGAARHQPLPPGSMMPTAASSSCFRLCFRILPAAVTGR